MGDIETHILEDNVDERFLIETELSKHEGLRPFFIHGRSSELLKAFNSRTHVVAVDNRLDEGMTGVELIRKIKKDCPDRDIYWIVITGFVTESVLLDFVMLRPNAFIRKQPDGRHIAELAEAVLAGRKEAERMLAREHALEKLQIKSNELTQRLKSKDNDNCGSD